ncbi:MAG: DegT/DnrJ/EryC1/StrS family aminotransferase [Candidatus Omnitrophota bacterium]
MKSKKQPPRGAPKTVVPYFDLNRQYPLFSPQVEQAVLRVMRSGKFVLSPDVEAFEKGFAESCGVANGIGVGSGTDALIFALKAVGVRAGDEVIVPSYTFVASVFAILHLGAVPVFADISAKTYTLDPAEIEKLAGARTRAVMPVHLFGRMADMEAIGRIAKLKKLKIVEDACQAHGALWKSKGPGAISDAACFSFYPTKNLGAFGDGGMVVTRNESLAQVTRRLRNLGRATHFDHKEPGWTSRLDAIQSAVLSVKLSYLPVLNQKRIRVAEIYRKKLASTPLVLPQETPGCRQVYHIFSVQVPGGKRDALKAWLEKKGVGTMVHYALPVHCQPFYLEQFDSKSGSRLPVTNRLSQESLSLPMFPELTPEEIDYVCSTILDFYRQRGRRSRGKGRS